MSSIELRKQRGRGGCCKTLLLQSCIVIESRDLNTQSQHALGFHLIMRSSTRSPGFSSLLAPPSYLRNDLIFPVRVVGENNPFGDMS